MGNAFEIKRIDGILHPAISIIILFIIINTGCYGSNTNKQHTVNKGHETGNKKNIAAVDEERYNKGVLEGYQRGHAIGKKRGQEVGYIKGYTDGFKKGENAGYKKGTKFFVDKWWQPTLGLTILALIALAFFLTVYSLIRKPLKRLIFGWEENLEMERVIKNRKKK
ncbi:MAG: hypothetical protein GY757_40995 [bacterium]|nr:hypothetical protein [bacterium]